MLYVILTVQLETLGAELRLTVGMSPDTIETSLAVENKLGVWDWPCCCRNNKQWINRENLAMAKVTGLEDLLDTIDQIFSVKQTLDLAKIV